ncbi:MAG TPA: hypothetical protein VE664_09490, partial [Actinomycetes bacterium]|nr:hypothetical protein [Actinomycetes bacterium]
MALGARFKANWMYRGYEDLVARYNNYPAPLQRLIERKLVALFGRAAAVRITDPEGTDISWEVTEEEAELWERGAWIPWHIIGSNPKTFRSVEGLWSTALPWVGLGPERYRAGVIHFGFGAEHEDPQLVKFGGENAAPIKHLAHVHSYFPDYEIRDRASGSWIKVIEEGWLTPLDDPEVRRLASTLGNPDDLLSYDWVPAMPGINYPGDYHKDYAADPVAWIERDAAGEF